MDSNNTTPTTSPERLCRRTGPHTPSSGRCPPGANANSRRPPHIALVSHRSIFTNGACCQTLSSSLSAEAHRRLRRPLARLVTISRVYWPSSASTGENRQSLTSCSPSFVYPARSVAGGGSSCSCYIGVRRHMSFRRGRPRAESHPQSTSASPDRCSATWSMITSSLPRRVNTISGNTTTRIRRLKALLVELVRGLFEGLRGWAHQQVLREQAQEMAVVSSSGSGSEERGSGIGIYRQLPLTPRREGPSVETLTQRKEFALLAAGTDFLRAVQGLNSTAYFGMVALIEANHQPAWIPGRGDYSYAGR
ncbi:hypothetical protein TYRP_023787 [Tyrophagus putrescentiae]|nr:hypothetical protein TYRP_023787 [Tyrophagus putrescentiae]